MSSCAQQALTREELTSIINDEEFWQDLEVDTPVNIITLPPEADELTDEEEANDEELGIVNVADVPGTLEVHCIQSEVQKDLEATSSKKKKEYNTASWKKKQPTYSKWNNSISKSHEKLSELQEYSIGKTPVEYFEQLFTHNIYNQIIIETLRYAKEIKNDSNFDISIEDLKVFVGILLLTGYKVLPSEKHYWSEDVDLGEEIVRNAMSRNRYQKIKSYLHFTDNKLANNNKSDRGYKIRPLINMFQNSFSKFGVFEENVAVDEMIIKYYGHNSLKQFIKAKPIRFGYKFWALCGSSGYCYNFNLYCGKDTNREPGVNLGTKVVLDMLEIIDDPSNYTVYFDNFFTSTNLLMQLAEMNYNATGTMRENRAGTCPISASKILQKQNRGCYDYRFDTNNEILIAKWNDNKCVMVGSNFDTVEPFENVSRWDKQKKEKAQFQQPHVLKNYNKFMGGVDHHDWLTGKYCTKVRGKKWYWPLFTRFIDMVTVNAWILYKKVNGPSAMNLLEFRRHVAQYYLRLSTKSKSDRPVISGKKETNYDVRTDKINNFILQRDEQRRCQMKNCKSRPRTYCEKCNITLCVQCFKPYHL